METEKNILYVYSIKCYIYVFLYVKRGLISQHTKYFDQTETKMSTKENGQKTWKIIEKSYSYKNGP